MRKYLRKLIRTRSHTSSPHLRDRVKRLRKLGFEPLEDRAMLAANTFGSIRGMSFIDVGNNGFDAANPDPPVVGVDVNLLQDDGTGNLTSIMTTTTDASGNYRFDGLAAGTYVVEQAVSGNRNLPTAQFPVTISAMQALGVPGLMIDDFANAQNVNVDILGTPKPDTRSNELPVPITGTNGPLAANGAAQGYRDLWLHLDSSRPFRSGTLEVDGNGNLSMTTDAGATGSAKVTWDGADDPSVVNPVGLRGTNATGRNLLTNTTNPDSDNTHIVIAAEGNTDQQGRAILRVYTDANRVSQATITLPSTPDEFAIPFTFDTTANAPLNFVAAPGLSPADFSNVGAIQLEIADTGESMDAFVTRIQAVSPTVITRNFANLELSLGDRVFHDMNNNGVFDAGESGIDGVTVNLLVDTTGNGFSDDDTAFAGQPTATTAWGGLFSFTNLPAGQYVLQIPQSQFASGAALFERGSYGGSNSAPDPNNNVDNDDNGTPVTGMGVVTGRIDLAFGTEPSNEAGESPPNNNSNNTVDFGFVTQELDLEVTKTTTVTGTAPGSPITYTITVVNHGPTPVSGATVTDDFPAELRKVVYNVLPSQGASVVSGGGLAGAGVGDISDTVFLPVNGRIRYTATGIIAPGASGSITNTARVAEPIGFRDTNSANNVATNTVSLVPQADLSVTKTGPATAIPGQRIQYTIVVANNGPSNVSGVTLRDVFPTGAGIDGLTNISYSSFAVGNVTGNTQSNGVGNITETLSMEAGSSVTYTVLADVSANVNGKITNMVEVVPPAGIVDPDLSNNNNFANPLMTMVMAEMADLEIDITSNRDNSQPVMAGDPITYTINVRNNASSPNDVPIANVLGTFSTKLRNITINRVPAPATALPGGLNINDQLNLPVGSSAVYTVMGFVKDAQTGTIDANVSVTANHRTGVVETDPPDNAATAVPLTIAALPVDLGIVKMSDTIDPVAPGDEVVWTVEVTNHSDREVIGARVRDVIPNMANVISIAADPHPPGQTTTTLLPERTPITPPIANTLDDVVNFAPHGYVTYTIRGKVNSTAIGQIDNWASIDTGFGYTDTNPDNNEAHERVLINARINTDLEVKKTDGFDQRAPGSQYTYTVTLANKGPQDAYNLTFEDTLPADFTLDNFMSTVSAATVTHTNPNSSDPTLRSIVDTVLTLPVGEEITYLITGTVSNTPTLSLLTNTAMVTFPSGTSDPVLTNNMVQDVNAIFPQAPSADLEVIMIGDGQTNVDVGYSLTYEFIVRNNGPTDVAMAQVNVPSPVNLTLGAFRTETLKGTIHRNNNPLDTDDVPSTTVLSPTFPDVFGITAGAEVRYYAEAVVKDDGVTNNVIFAPEVSATGASPVTDPNPANNSRSDIDFLPPDPPIIVPTPVMDVGVEITNAFTQVMQGDPVSYTITVRNHGNVPATDAQLHYTPPAQLVNPTISPAITTPLPTIAPGGTLTYIVNATVSDLSMEPIVNRVHVQKPGDSNPLNDWDEDRDSIGTPSQPTPPQNPPTNPLPSADLAITKTDNAVTVAPGELVTYETTVTNLSSTQTVSGAIFEDLIDTTKLEIVRTPSPPPPMLIPGIGGLTPTTTEIVIPNGVRHSVILPPGSSVKYTVVARVASGLTDGTVITNTATITPPITINDPNLLNNEAVDRDTVVVALSSISGFVFKDNNNDGNLEAALGEVGIGGQRIELTGVNDLGQNVSIEVRTVTAIEAAPLGSAPLGSYKFENLRPGTYTIRQIDHPAGFVNGVAKAGTPSLPVNVNSVESVFEQIGLGAGINAVDFNFGEGMDLSIFI